MADERRPRGRPAPRSDDKRGGPRSSGSRSSGPRKPYGERSFDRPRRDEGEGGERPRRSYGERKSFGDRPRREGDERPRRDFGDRPPRRDFGDRPPRRDFNDRPRRDEGEGGERPRRSYGERKSFGDRPRREGDDRPRRDFGDRPPRRDFGDRPRRDFDDRGDRPQRRNFRDDKPEGRGRPTPRQTHWVEKDPYEAAPQDDGWLVGTHAVSAALQAGRRSVAEVLMAATEAEVEAFRAEFPMAKVRIVKRNELNERFPSQVHQGIAAKVGNLPQPDLDEILKQAPRLLVGLDQVTDPHNFGAVLRSCAAFNVGGVIATERRSAGVTSVVAKAAAGALEIVPVVEVTNLATTLKKVQEAGYRVIGLAGDAEATLADIKPKAKDKLCIVLGSEGEGLRRLTRETCDMLVTIPMGDAIESLNVSVAAGVTLSSLFKKA